MTLSTEVNGIWFTFVCSTTGARNGFDHHCVLYVNHRRLVVAKRHYINRTWEAYQYQSVCLTALDGVIEGFRERELKLYKEVLGFKVMPQKRKAVFEEWLQTSDNESVANPDYNVSTYYKALLAVRKRVSSGKFAD